MERHELERYQLNAWRFLTKPRGDRRWDLFLQATGAAALVLIPIPLLFPKAVPLVWLAIVGVPTNGPLSPIFPTTFDPLIVAAGKYAPAIPVTLVAVAVYMYMEFVNWHIYSWMLDWDRLEAIRHHRTVRWAVNRFARAPATTTVFFAATPLPFWVVRCLAILHGFPLARFMVATTIGRFPRFFFYAWIGSVLSIPTWMIVVAILAGVVLAVGARLARGRPIFADTTLGGTGGQQSSGGEAPLTSDPPLPLPEDESA